MSLSHTATDTSGPRVSGDGLDGGLPSGIKKASKKVQMVAIEAVAHNCYQLSEDGGSMISSITARESFKKGQKQLTEL